MAESVVGALQATGLDVYDQPTQLAHWVDPDVFEVLQWRSDRPLYLSTRIWVHRVVLTAGEVRIDRGRSVH